MCWKIYKIKDIPEDELDIWMKRFTGYHMHILELFDDNSLMVKKFFSEHGRLVDPLQAINRVLVWVRYPFDWRRRPTDHHRWQAFKIFNGRYRVDAKNYKDFWQRASETAWCRWGDCEDSSILMHTYFLMKNIDAFWCVGEVYYKDILLGGQGMGWGVNLINENTSDINMELRIYDGINGRLIYKASTKDFDVSYIIGVYYGDGYIIYNENKHKYIFGLHVHKKDFELIERFVTILKSWGSKVNISLDRENYVHIRVYNKSLCDFLRKISYKDIYKNCDWKGFISGLWDSEGNLYISYRKNKKCLDYRARIVNKDIELLRLVQKMLLESINLISGIRKHAKNTYVLDIHGRKKVERFLRYIKPSLYRKSIEYLLDLEKYYERYGKLFW